MNLQKITGNRKKVMQKMIQKNEQAKNPFYLAAYFQIPLKQAALDVEEILPGNDQFSVFDLDDLTQSVNARNTKMEQLSRQGLPKDDIMEKFGMWHWPFNVLDTSKIPSIPLEDKKYPVKYAISDYKVSPTQENIAKILTCARNRIDRTDTFLYLSQSGIRMTDLQISGNYVSVMTNISTALDMERNFNYKAEVRAALIDLKEEYKLDEIEIHTGVSKSIINTIETIKKEPILSKSQQKKQEMIEKVWHLYTNGGKNHTEGLKQEEIGQMLGITRHTVSTYLREYKTLHPEVVDHTQLLRPRHTGLSAKQYKDKEYPQLAENYRMLREKGNLHYIAIEKVANEFDTTVYHVRRAAIQAGYYVPQQDLKETPLEQATKFAKEGYQANQVSTPATRKIMETHKDIATPKGSILPQKVRFFVEQRNRDSMDMVRADNLRKKEFLKAGDLKAALPKEKVKFGLQQIQQEQEIILE